MRSQLSYPVGAIAGLILVASFGAPIAGVGDIVPGMVVLRFSSADNPPLGSVQLSPAAVGISELDEILAAIPTSSLQPILPNRHVNASESRDRLERTFILWFAEEFDPDSVVTLLSTFPEFEEVRVERYERVHFFGTRRHEPSDNKFGDQWNLDSSEEDEQDIDAPEAWEIERGDPAIIIGITDTGTMVDTTGGEPWRFHSDLEKFVNIHEDISNDAQMRYEDVDEGDSQVDADLEADNVVGYNFSPRNKGTLFQRAVWRSVPFNALLRDDIFGGAWNIIYYYPHGLSVASIAASKEGAASPGQSSVCGVAPQCKVYQVRSSLTPDPDEFPAIAFLASPTLDAAVIEHAAIHSSVINMSWGFDFLTPEAEQILLDAVKTATDPIAAGGFDCVLVASVGNASEVDPDEVVAPARFPQVIGVGNMTKARGLYSDSVYGPEEDYVSVVAPVDDGIPAATNGQCLFGFPCPIEEQVNDLFGGTSAASPQVAGIAALVRSRFRTLDQAQVVDRILKSAEWYWSDPPNPTDRKKFGKGKVNAYRALTEWGEITTNTTWSPTLPRDGKYYVSGDLTIESGTTLTIAAGTVVRIAPDHEESGADPARVQIVVRSGATLNINGSATSPVVFESFNDDISAPNDWIGIKLEAGSSASFTNVEFKHAARAIENYASVTITNCKFTDCVTAIDAHANVNASGTLIANNSSSVTAVDVHAGTASFTKCTFANNVGSAIAVRGSSLPVYDYCVAAFNGGPAIRILPGWTGATNVQRTVVHGNTPAAGSPTDAELAQWGTNTWNENPAFCNSAIRDYKIYAFSPAAKGPHFFDRAGAFDIGCVPGVSVSTSGLTQACPGEDGATLTISLQLQSAVMTRDVGASEIKLDVTDFDSLKVFDADGVISASGPATSANGYSTTIQHKYFGYYGKNDAVEILLNGVPLLTPAVVHVRTADCAATFGTINVVDFSKFNKYYTSPPKFLLPACDFNDLDGINLVDFQFFGQHYGHASQYGQINAPSELLQSNARIALQFTEEFPTATTHKLYVDFDAESFTDLVASVFSMVAGSDRLSLAEWQPAGSSIGAVLFTPVLRDGTSQLFFGVHVSESFTEPTARLGRLVFDVTGTEPFEVTDDHFSLTIGDVLMDSEGQGPVTAQMNGSVDRAFDPIVARVYHNRLEQNFPNPFNPTTTLAYSLKDASNVNLTIYDVAGRQVRELVNERRERGAYRVVWDGRNDTGTTVSSGVYFYKLVAGSFTDTKKMTILK